MTVNLAEVVDLDSIVEEVFYCDDCELIESQFVPEDYPEELKCGCSEDDSTDNEYLYW
jgi:hypothetical protein